MFEPTVTDVHLAHGQRSKSPVANHQMPGTLDWGIAIAVWVTCSTLLLCFQAYLQNTNIATTNGLWQSVELRHWMEGSGYFDFANALYYPVYGFLCRTLGGFGLLWGPLWWQMTELNAVFAGLGLYSRNPK